MKTKLFPILLGCAFAAFPLYSQVQSCDPPQAAPQRFDLLDFKLLMHRDGNLWALYEQEDYEWYSASGGLWIGAQTPDQTLRVAAHTNAGNVMPGDFWPGPLMDDGFPNLDWCPLFDRIWKISRQEIDAFVSDWEDNQQLDNPVPEVILSWPGSGNPYYLQQYLIALPQGSLAPFFDRNANQIYEPLLGDFPLIKGDAALWKMINDAAGPHIETQALPLRVQLKVMAYTFDNADPLLSNTIFYNISIQNKNPEPLHDLRAGIWMDDDLECPYWRRWTVFPDKNLAYFFNLFEPGDTCGGIPPGLIQEWNHWLGVKLLQSPLPPDTVFHSKISGLSYYKHSSFGNPQPGASNPNIDMEYYRYLTNYWRDGSPFTYGGDGYQTGDPYPFTLPDPLHDTIGWSACTAEWPDYLLHTLMNIPLGDFAPGERKSFDLAFFQIPEPATLCEEPLQLAGPGDALQEFWEEQVVATTDRNATNSDIFVFPNPAAGAFTVRCPEGPVHWRVWDMQGKLAAAGESQGPVFEVPAEEWHPGLYALEVRIKAGSAVVKMVIQ